jgi:hypothetical protein
MRDLLTLLIFLVIGSLAFLNKRWAVLFQTLSRWIVGSSASDKTWRIVGYGMIWALGAALVAATYFVNRGR